MRIHLRSSDANAHLPALASDGVCAYGDAARRGGSRPGRGAGMNAAPFPRGLRPGRLDRPGDGRGGAQRAEAEAGSGEGALREKIAVLAVGPVARLRRAGLMSS